MNLPSHSDKKYDLLNITAVYQDQAGISVRIEFISAGTELKICIKDLRQFLEGNTWYLPADTNYARATLRLKWMHQSNNC